MEKVVPVNSNQLSPRTGGKRLSHEYEFEASASDSDIDSVAAFNNESNLNVKK